MAVQLWVALIAVLIGLGFLIVRRGPKLNVPPGPLGIPVLGNLRVLGGPKLPHVSFSHLSKQYGPLMFLRLGSTPCIVASSPEVFKEILKDQDRVFASRKQNTAVEILYYGGRGIGFAPYGEHWRTMRKVATLELLTQKKTAEFEGFRVAEVLAMVGSIFNHSKLYGSTEKSDPINLSMMLKGLTLNFTTQICFGKRFFQYPSQVPVSSTSGANVPVNEINPEEAKEFNHLIDELAMLLGTPRIADYVPYLSFLDWFTDQKARMIKTHKRFDEFLCRLLEEHRKHPKHENLDFLDVLLSFPGLEEDSIKTLSMELLAAGTETSAGALEWMMTEVIRHPRVAAKVMEELDTVVGKGRLVTEADIPNLLYLQAVVKEAFRFHPVTPLLLPHLSTEQTKLMGYDIPKATMVFFNIWAVQRDPAVWENPMEFRPERFLEDSEIDVKGQHYQLLPFGSGRRGCPAMVLALTTVHYALARLLQAFNWSLPNGMKPENLDIEEGKGLTAGRAHALEAVPTPRLPSLLY